MRRGDGDFDGTYAIANWMIGVVTVLETAVVRPAEGRHIGGASVSSAQVPW